MKVDKIARLFSAQSEPALETQTQPETIASQVAPEAGAVRVSSSMQEPGSAESNARAARVAQLKEQVANGSYNPDPQKVASAVLQDLFA